MTWRESLRTSLEGLGSHRLRSALTVIGILIGIAAVILTVGLGEGAQDRVAAQIAALGTNLLEVLPGGASPGLAQPLTSFDASALASKVDDPDIARVAPTMQLPMELFAGSQSWTTTLVATTPSWLPIRDRQVLYGRFIDGSDDRYGAPVVVLGPTTAEKLYGAGDPVGRQLKISGVAFTVVGVLAPIGSVAAMNEDDQALIPITTGEQHQLYGPDASLQAILLQATSHSTLDAADQEATDQLLALQQTTNPSRADFTITGQTALDQAATSVNSALTTLLDGVAAIALLVGGIGVMNIMLVSVAERIREIGLRKALGATPALIRRQFLLESSLLGLSGGAIGIGVGVGTALILPRLISDPVAISPLAIGGALVIAVAIGLAFGVYPATRAARLSPIDALRQE